MTLKDDVFRILASEMGPAAGPFLARQCKTRLNKNPEQLVVADLPALARGIEIGAAVILGDTAAANLASRVRGLIISAR